MALGGGIVYAYYSASGAGSGSGTAGSAAAPTVNQAAAACADYSAWNTTDATPGAGTCNLFPTTNQTVHLTVTNNGNGAQYINKVSLTGWSSNKSGCNSTTLPGSFTMADVTVGETVAAAGTWVATTGWSSSSTLASARTPASARRSRSPTRPARSQGNSCGGRPIVAALRAVP